MARRYHHPVIASTQEEAIRLARAGAADGTRVVADRQENGRGRLDRTWASPPGGLYVSIVVRAPPSAGLLPIAVGARLAGVLEARFGARTRVKWPNDLLAVTPGRPPRKLAGILIDRVDSPTLGDACVVGVGLNVAAAPSAFPEPLRSRVVRLADLAGRPVSPPEVEPLVADAVASAAASISDADGRAQLLDECRALLYGVDRPARIDGAPAGVIREIGADGALLLERDGERTSVRSGELTFEESA